MASRGQNLSLPIQQLHATHREVLHIERSVTTWLQSSNDAMDEICAEMSSDVSAIYLQENTLVSNNDPGCLTRIDPKGMVAVYPRTGPTLPTTRSTESPIQARLRPSSRHGGVERMAPARDSADFGRSLRFSRSRRGYKRAGGFPQRSLDRPTPATFSSPNAATRSGSMDTSTLAQGLQVGVYRCQVTSWDQRPLSTRSGSGITWFTRYSALARWVSCTWAHIQFSVTSRL